MVIKKKGQVFVEFFAIFIIVMIGFMIFLFAGVHYIDELIREYELKSINIVLNDFKIKTLAAVDSVSDFNTSIHVPDKIDERDFDIYMEDSNLLILMGQTGGDEGHALSVSRLLPGVTGDVIKGCNLLMKNDTAIHIFAGGC